MSAMRSVRRVAKKGVSKMQASEYVSLSGYLGGPTVTVLVGVHHKRYTLPRELMCRSSDYFKACFEGNFKEGEKQTSDLSDVEPKYFEYILQWIGTENIVLDEEPDLRAQFKETPAHYATHELKEYLAFLLLADKLLIVPNPNVIVIGKMRTLLEEFAEDDCVGGGVMIHEAWSLPSNHPVRQLIFDATIGDYILSRFSSCYKTEDFILSEELRTIPEFASDFLDFAAGFILESVKTDGERYFNDPVTGRCRTF